MQKNEFSKQYITTLIVWAISSFAAMFASFLSINYTNPDVMVVSRGITCLLAGLSSVLSIFVVCKKLNMITNVFLVSFPIILFLCLFFFSKKIDYLLYNLYFFTTVIFLIVELILYWIKKDKKEIANAVFPILYSCALMIIKTIELDRYVTELDDSIISCFIYFGLGTAILSIIIYLCFSKNKISKKEYFGKLFLTFFSVFICCFGIPYSATKNINYSFDSSEGISCEYKIVRKNHSIGGKRSAGNYYVVILYNGVEVKFKLPSEEYKNTI